MQSRLRNLLLPFSLMLSASYLGAAIVDSPDVNVGGNSYRSFRDTVSGHEWLDLDNFLALNGNPQTYNTLEALLTGTGYHIANWTEISALDASMRQGDPSWLSLAIIIGANYAGNPNMTGNRELMWGILDNGSGTNVDYALRFDSQPQISYTYTGLSRDTVFSDLNSTDRDLGAWIVSDAPVPEPGTFLLIGAGLVLAGLRRNQMP